MLPVSTPPALLDPGSTSAPLLVPVVTTDDSAAFDLFRPTDEIVVRASRWASLPNAVIEAANRLRRAARAARRDAGSFDRCVRPALAALRHALAAHALEMLIGQARLDGGQVRPSSLVVVIGIAAIGSRARALLLGA